LPGKPLADIVGKPMIVHVLERAIEAGVGPVFVACSEPEVAKAVEKAGGTAVLTDPDLPSGTDRIWAALQQVDKAGKFDVIINVQGDLPTLAPELVRAALRTLQESKADIGTLVAEIHTEAELNTPSVVKALVDFTAGEVATATDFIRTRPAGKGPHYHHIGMYAYRRSALQRFTALPPSKREQEVKLEQLRALDKGMRIAALCVDEVPFGVDTPEDLARARKQLS
ncbi:MAG: 3-deoxy-manno-octulosonate cytidylyltransferase, partial [Alphaproteobacteria bacterium]|nr:3-deoxy-manno-octulosonate cytidylyltransferase [Alphaproteobacteria bacterium]